MSAQLFTTVYVHDEDGQTHIFGPGDDVPDWARERITNPEVWGGPVSEPPVAVAALPEGEPSDEWKLADLAAYAKHHGINLGDAKRKTDILSMIEEHRDSTAAESGREN
ncbi:hypothetical protein [Rhodococcus ruber]|uniref:hypothetical protein n=1 Tax=Rhodococcus ruber TaxID=1830 RepID=UPI003D8125D4